MEQLGVEMNRHLKSIQPGSSKSKPEDLQPEKSYSCDICQDWGWVSARAPVGDPLFGKALPCSCRTYKHAFETFKPVEGTAQAVEAAKQFAVGEGPMWLVLNGVWGSGKTHLAGAVYTELMRKWDLSVHMVYVPALLEQIKDGFDDGSYKEIRATAMTVKTLILDDLGDGGRDDPQTEGIGRNATTPWERREITDLLNHRYAREMRTMITTNHTRQEITKLYGGRLADRMFGTAQGFSTVVSLECDSYR